MIVVFEGIDGSGKDTQANLLLPSLSNSKLIHYPDRNGVFGDLLNSFLNHKKHFSPDSLMTMFLMDMYKDRKMLEKYKSNSSEHLLIVRYAHSTLAYQSAQGLDYNYVRDFINNFDLIIPDYVILFDADPSVSLGRNNSSEYFEKLKFLEDVRSKYRKMLKDHFLGKNFYQINAHKSIMDVHLTIKKYLKF